MKRCLLFVVGLIAFIVLLAMIGPMILLGVGVLLLYVIFKQFMKSESTAGKIGWVITALLLLSTVVASNIYAVIGLVAAYALYVVISKWRNNDHVLEGKIGEDDDPFTNFERQWAELNK
ncbi:flagellar basal body rod protein [Domibacillus mangrovi]|uniref:Flagellar basal body rod protein n=1 Tax=Domibacillus mangrovi TaxID=1714354 RepID=A0A1Q5P6C4_9BACI|nr:flagellar basal body rod protein [Domibacillus mangrovi]OKL37701.1 flagellar basal body rod protein [Domibacillus mangrovi]